MSEKQNTLLSVDPSSGISLVHVPPTQWHRFVWPDYQRSPNPSRVKQIAQGIRAGYDPGPVTLYEIDGRLNVVDGGHRIKAYMHNRIHHGIDDPILAIVYQKNAIEQNLTFILENTKMRMNPTCIIKADSRSIACARIRALGEKGGIFMDFGALEAYPIKPLTLIKAAIILNLRGDDLAINSLAYLSVARAVAALDRMIADDEQCWKNLEALIRYEIRLWGCEGRHLLNFGVLGFAYFLAKNAPAFFGRNGLEIRTKRLLVSKKRGAREFESADRSDFGKLKALQDRWDKPGDQLRINASRDPVAIALEINSHFWKNRSKSLRIWRPETTL